MQKSRFLFRLLKRRLPVALAVMAGFAVIGLLVGVARPITYKADAILMASFGQIDEGISQSGVQTDEILSLQVIQQKILTRNRLEEIKGKLNGNPDLDIQDLRDSTSINISGGPALRGPSQPIVVRVSFSHKSPEIAADVANEIAREIASWNKEMRLDISARNLELSLDALNQLSRDVEAKTAEVRSFKLSHSDALPESLAILRTEKELYESQLVQLEEERALIEGRLAGGGSKEASEIESRLQEIQIEYETLASVYTSTHPRLKELSGQMSVLNSRGERLAVRSGLEDEAATQNLHDKLHDIEEKKQDILIEIQSLEESIVKTPVIALDQSRIEGELAKLTADHDEARRIARQARSQHLIEQQYMERRIELVEPAIATNNPNGVSFEIFMSIFAIAGLSLGSVLAVTLEYIDKTIRHPADISKSIGIDVIGSVPFIPSDQENLHSILRNRLAPLVIPT